MPFDVIAQPGLGKLPIASHRLLRKIQHPGHLGMIQAGEVAKLDQLGLLRIARGHAVVPLDEALVEAVVDLSGRPHLTWNARLPSGKRFIGAYDVDLTQDFFQALVNHARICIHVNVRYGRNLHHVVEAIFKATARALRAALRREGEGLPSTKGVL